MEKSQQQTQTCVYFNIIPPDWFVTKGWLWLWIGLANVAMPGQRQRKSYSILMVGVQLQKHHEQCWLRAALIDWFRAEWAFPDGGA